MPFCNQCGQQVGDADLYCAVCGSKQPLGTGTAQAARSQPDPFSKISPRAAAILCYIPFCGWIASIVVLVSDRFRSDRAVRFHAFQALYLFVAWLIVEQVIGPVMRLAHSPIRVDKILETLIVFICVFMIVKVSQEQTYSLPIIGELAEKSAAE